MFVTMLFIYLLLTLAPLGVIIGLYMVLRACGFSFRPYWKR